MTTHAPSQTQGLRRLYRDLWLFAEGRRGLLAVAMTLLLASQLIRLAVPYLSGRAINALQLNGLAGMEEAALWLLAVFGATAGGWLLHGPGRLLERNVALQVRSRVTELLMSRVLRLPLAWHESQHSGATAHRIEQCVRAIYEFAGMQFIYLQQAVQLVGPIAALWVIEPMVGIAALVGLALISLSLTRFDRAMMRLAVVENEADRRYAAAMIDSVGNIVSVLALRQARGVLALLARRLEAIYAPLKRGIVLNEAKWCSVDILSMGLSCLLLALYAWLAARGISHAAPVAANTVPSPTLPLGNIYMVWEYALRAGAVISGIASHYQTIARQQADYLSGDLIRDAAPMPEPPRAASDANWKALELRELQFRHASGRSGAPALDLPLLRLQRGRRYALIGGSGSGKTTLLRVLAGLHAPTSLQLAIDGSIRNGDVAAAALWLRGTTTLIPQDAEVFEGSLAENLALCESPRGAPDTAAFPAALRTSCAADFVDASEAGLKVEIAERGANWSGGQRQRVALARGVLAAEASRLVLLDEPTAALDPATERRVYDNLFAAFPEACIVSSVHRLNLLNRFDEVLLMDGGRLIEHGSVDELRARSERFRALLAAQHNAEST